VAGQPRPEATHQLLAQDGRQLFGRPLAVEGVGADQVDVLLRDAGLRQLGEDGLDDQAAHRPEGGHRRVVEGDEHAGARTYQLSDARQAERLRQGVANGLGLVRYRLEAAAQAARWEPRAVGQADFDGGVTVGQRSLDHSAQVISDAAAARKGGGASERSLTGRESEAGRDPASLFCQSKTEF